MKRRKNTQIIIAEDAAAVHRRAVDAQRHDAAALHDARDERQEHRRAGDEQQETVRRDHSISPSDRPKTRTAPAANVAGRGRGRALMRRTHAFTR
jgi:hypothetical protein